MDEPIEVVAHNPAWPELGRGLVAQVERVLSGLRVDVAHIGSTSVPGLAAKPVIDVQVGCAVGDTGRVVNRLRELGFEHLGQTGGPGREYLRRRGAVPANVAVVERQGRIWTANILFRDHLRENPDAAARYALAKQKAAEATGMLTAYSQLKATIVAELMDEAGQ